MRVSLDAGAVLGGDNRVECARWYADHEPADAPYAREFVLGAKALVTSGHYFDTVGGISIGDGSWIAGRGSQFWSHGLGVKDRAVRIGRYCYVGSAVRFAPGARLGDLAVVGLGSVVTGDMSEHRSVLVAGVPATVVREEYRVTGWAALDDAIREGLVEGPTAQ